MNIVNRAFINLTRITPICLGYFSLPISYVTQLLKSNNMGKWSHYAVANGRKKGIFTNWGDCKKQIDGFKGARFKGFNSREDAEK